MADESLSEAFVEAPIEDPVLACVVSLRDRLPTCDVRKLILDNFAVSAIKSAKKLLWAARQAVLRQNKKKLIDRRAAQRAVEEVEFEDLIDFVDCLDECEKLPLVSVSAKDLVLLPAAAFKPRPRSESTEDIAGVLSSHRESFETIQNKITVLERELQSNICAVQESVNQVSLQLKGHFSDDPSHYRSAHRQTEKAGSREHTDRSLNVVVFGVPESRDLLGMEALVSRAFESVVGRKVTFTDCRRIGRFSTESVRSRPLLVKFASVWDRRLLLSSKYKLKDFSEANLFVREDRPPNERKGSARQQASQQGVSATTKSLAHQGGDPSSGARIDLVDNGEHVN